MSAPSSPAHSPPSSHSLCGDLLHVGTCTRAHGLTGELCLAWHASSPDVLCGLIYLQSGTGEPIPVTQGQVRIHKGRPLLRLPHINDRTSAEGLRGTRILLPRASLPPLSADEAYVVDILGRRVVDDTTGQYIGELARVSFPAGQQIWHIMTPGGDEVLFPAVSQFIVCVDNAEQVRIAPPPGLLEIYLGASS